jgi:GNAT superfamily N-acetyltransferase
VEIQRLGTHDAARLRDVRLRALHDTPFAFSSWFGRETEYPPALWEGRVTESELGRTGIVFVAVEQTRSVGMAGGYFPGGQREQATLWGMWVDPDERRRGVGRALVQAVATWARDVGAVRLRLAVTDCEESRPAAALYRELGFMATGEREPLESDPSLVALIMSREL